MANGNSRRLMPFEDKSMQKYDNEKQVSSHNLDDEVPKSQLLDFKGCNIQVSVFSLLEDVWY